MKYVKTSQGYLIEYPYSILKIRNENPNVSFPSEMSEELLAEYGVYPVLDSTPPETTIFEQLVEIDPVLINGQWIRQYTTGPAKVPGIITRRQCALQLLSMQTITSQEALDMTKSAEVPAVVAQVFAGMPADQKILAEIDFAATNYYRDNSLLTMMGLSSQEVDNFFIAAAER